MIEEPMFFDGAFSETALSIEKFSIPHVSGIHIVSTEVLDNVFEHSRTSGTDKSEPRLHAILIDKIWYLYILVFPLNNDFEGFK